MTFNGRLLTVAIDNTRNLSTRGTPPEKRKQYIFMYYKEISVKKSIGMYVSDYVYLNGAFVWKGIEKITMYRFEASFPAFLTTFRTDG